MIIDSHVHAFPPVAGMSGFPSVEAHMRGVQCQSYYNINPVRRARDHEIVERQTLWNGIDPGPEGLTDVDMRGGSYGRLEWTTEDGEELYVQLFSPSLRDNSAPPEYVIAEMDYANVGMAVLQTGPTYGRLNDYLARCAEQYPDRFIALAQVQESLAHTHAQLETLSRCAEELGMKGIFYSTLGFWEDGYKSAADDAKYHGFWDEIARLGLVVYWDINVGPLPAYEGYLDQLERLGRVLERHPAMSVVLVQAFPVDTLAAEGRYRLPDIAFELGRAETFLFEIAYPISYGRRYEYPYRELLPLVEQLLDWFGPERLVWGSDFPNVLRHCTYEQSHRYLTHSELLNDEDLSLVLGGNVARLFKVQSGR